MRTILLVFLLSFMASCNQTKTASTTKGSINAEAPYLWVNPNFPKTLRISTAFVDGEPAKIEATGDQWSTSLENEVDFFNYTTTTEKSHLVSSPSKLNDGILGIYKSDPWIYPDYPEALAVTQIFGLRHNRGYPDEHVSIEEADIIMNYDGFTFDEALGWDNYDFRTVMLHEMGHFLGLGHKTILPKAETVMYPSINHTEVKQVPFVADISDLASKYNIALSGSGNPTNMGSLPVYEPRDAGERVKIILELRADGMCVHHEDGAEVLRHQLSLK